MLAISQKIFIALNKGRLKPTEGFKKWHKYKFFTQKLFCERNLSDGYIIDVYDLNDNFLERVKIEIKPVIEFGCVHNKMFLTS